MCTRKARSSSILSRLSSAPSSAFAISDLQGQLSALLFKAGDVLQAKRTNIGIALITNPQVLFLDEPTSGLDSYTTHEVHPPYSYPAPGNTYQALLSIKR